MPFAIREFQPPDFDSLWRIDQECFPPGISYSKTELKVYMRRKGAFTLIAVDGGTGAYKRTLQEREDSRADAEPHFGAIEGFIVAEAGSRGSGHVITIDVVATARRAGVGSLLLNAAEERLRSARCNFVELETAVDNISALLFYKRHGYHVTRTFPRYYSNGVDALLLEKELKRI